MAGTATITQKLADYLHLPNIEAVQLTIDDEQTYVSEKFKVILGALVSGNTDTDTAGLNVTFSGSTATINWNGVSSQKVTLILFGRK